MTMGSDLERTLIALQVASEMIKRLRASNASLQEQVSRLKDEREKEEVQRQRLRVALDAFAQVQEGLMDEDQGSDETAERLATGNAELPARLAARDTELTGHREAKPSMQE